MTLFTADICLITQIIMSSSTSSYHLMPTGRKIHLNCACFAEGGNRTRAAYAASKQANYPLLNCLSASWLVCLFNLVAVTILALTHFCPSRFQLGIEASQSPALSTSGCLNKKLSGLLRSTKIRADASSIYSSKYSPYQALFRLKLHDLRY